MSPTSALLGEPPANHNDYLIVKAWNVFVGAGSLKDPNEGFETMPRPPPGKYHFESRTWIIYTYCSIAIFLVVLATSARIVIRVRNYKLRFGWDDRFIILGTISAISSPSLTMATVTYGGIGKHFYDLTYKESNFFMSTVFARNIVFYITLSLVKMSIVLFYMRLNGFTSRKWMITHWVLFTLCGLLGLISTIVYVFACIPVQPNWNFKAYAALTTKPTCIQSYTFLITLNVWHICTDAALLIVPVAMLWDVKMKMSTKFRVWIVGIVGCLNIFLSIGRTIFNHRLIQPDPTWLYMNLNAWTISEITLGCITASLPVLSVFVTNTYNKHIAPVLFRHRRQRHGPASKNYVFKKYHHQRRHNWPGGRNRHEDVSSFDDRIGLSGTTTVSDGPARTITNRYIEEYEREDGDHELDGRCTEITGSSNMEDVEMGKGKIESREDGGGRDDENE